jgi:zinc protease
MNKMLIACWLAAFSISSFAATNQNLAIEKKVKTDPTFKVGKLSNGLTYYIKKNPNPKDLADFYIIQNVGAILENDDQNGLAHFLEHMAFNGTKNFPGKRLLDYFQSIGVKFGGNINAYTAKDETVYYLASVPTTRKTIVDSALLALHDWSSFISLEDKEIDDERGVIREEWRMRSGDGTRLKRTIEQAIYQDSKYAIRDVIGDTAVINNFEHQRLKDYYHKWYRPDLQAIVIVGDINPAEVEARISNIFADIKMPINPTPRPTFDVPDNKEPRYNVTADPEAKNCNVRIYHKFAPFPKEKMGTEEYLRYQTTNNIVESLIINRFEEIQQSLNPDFLSSKIRIGDLVPAKKLFFVGVTTKNNGMAKGFQRMLTELKRIKEFGFTSSEIDVVKKKIFRTYESNYTERENCKNDAYVISAKNNFLNGDPIVNIEDLYQWHKDNLQSISLDEINKIAATYITNDNNIIVATGPLNKNVSMITVDSLKSIAAEVTASKVEPYKNKVAVSPLMAQKPAKGKIVKETTNVDLGTTEWMLSNGIKVVLKPNDLRKDQITFTGFSKGGYSNSSLEDLPSAYYAAGFINSSGIADHSAAELKRILSGAKLSVQPEISEFYQGISGYASPKDAETMFQLINLYIVKPRIDTALCISLINRKKVSSENESNSSKTAFADTINQVLFNRSPYRYHENGKMLDKIDPVKSFQFYKERFASMKGFTFIFTGNIDKNELKSYIETYIASIPTTSKKDSWKDNGKRLATQNYKVHFASSMSTDKTSIYLAYVNKAKDDLATQVVASAISYDLRMRFLATLREREGGTYSVTVKNSMLSEPISQSFIAIRFDTDPKIADRMLSLLYNEVNNLLKDGVSDENLKRIKESAIKNHKKNLQSPDYWQEVLTTYYMKEKNINKDYEKIVSELTSASIQKAAQDLIGKGRLVEIVMNPKQ